MGAEDMKRLKPPRSLRYPDTTSDRSIGDWVLEPDRWLEIRECLPLRTRVLAFQCKRPNDSDSHFAQQVYLLCESPGGNLFWAFAPQHGGLSTGRFVTESAGSMNHTLVTPAEAAQITGLPDPYCLDRLREMLHESDLFAVVSARTGSPELEPLTVAAAATQEPT